MPRKTMIEAIRDAMDVMMGRDDDVVVFGEDVGSFGGVFLRSAVHHPQRPGSSPSPLHLQEQKPGSAPPSVIAAAPHRSIGGIEQSLPVAA